MRKLIAYAKEWARLALEGKRAEIERCKAEEMGHRMQATKTALEIRRVEGNLGLRKKN
jgi:hypothetical protein